MKITVPATQSRRFRKFTNGSLFAFAFAVLIGQTGGHAQSPDALPYARGFLITGNYVVGGVELPNGGGTGDITFTSEQRNAVPPDADIVGAYLYWETLAPVGAPPVDAMFRGAPIGAAKASRLTALPGGRANCWGSSGNLPRALTMYRADVLHMLPKLYDADDKWTGRYVVNNTSHQVALGKSGGGNTLTTHAGATLLIIYRDLSEPLRKIVVYDGVHAQAQGATTTQTLRGFYRSSAAPSAQITHIVGSGAKNTRERLLFNGTVVATDPFPEPLEKGAGRGWANPTVHISSLMPGNDANDGYGEYVTTSVDHGPGNPHDTPYECLAWAAIVFSTAVADVDYDGLPDGIEDAAGGLKDPPTPAFPHGTPLPDFHGMGALVGQKDLFVELNAMQAPANTTYGSASAPFNAQHESVTDHVGHNHMPTPAVLKRVGDAYAAGGVAPHFDVGDLIRYRQLGPEYACLDDGPGSECDANPYLVPSEFARGGEIITERACATCQFQDFPGTVGWPYGFQLYRDALVANAGEELTTLDQIKQTEPEAPGTLRRRFDRNRHDFFHYALYAHARGRARSALPCLDEAGQPSEYDQIVDGVKACTTPNPQFHVPASVSGVADLPGGNLLVTLGLWDTAEFVGSRYVQASTTLHELGHNLNLWHGGSPAIWGSKAQGTVTYAQPNCKPNYLSSMSYLFQVHGLFDDNGTPQLDYSGAAHNEINETSLSDGVLFPAVKYRPVWFVPADSPLASARGASAARRFCDGGTIPPDAPPDPLLARLQAASTFDAIDWDGNPDTPAGALDANFDGRVSEMLPGHNDWANLRLDQIRGGRKARIFSSASGDLLDFGSGDLLDFGSGDLLDFGSGDLLDFGSGTHIVHFGSGDFFRYGDGDLLDFGSGDLLDFGSGDLLDFGSGASMFVGAEGDLLDFGSGDLLDFGSGDLLDFGSGDLLDFGSGDLLDFGSGDLLDFGSGDLLDFGSGSGLQELDFDNALAIAPPRPHGLAACVSGVDCPAPQPEPGAENYHRIRLNWNAPTFGEISEYEVYRGTATLERVLVGTSLETTFIDTEELPNGIEFVYSVRARFADGSLSAYSDSVAITAVNDPPVAENDSYVGQWASALTIIGAPGVLANDTDVDSPPASRRVFTVITRPSHGLLSVNADGSFTYAPNDPTFPGIDTFTYVADNGTWSRDSNILMSGVSNVATVTLRFWPVADQDAIGFSSVENLRPANRAKFSRGSTVPLAWRWTTAAGQALNSAEAGVMVAAYACSTGGKLPAAYLVGSFTPQRPGTGNSFTYDSFTNTWQFNWMLSYTNNETVHPLPVGTYVVQVTSGVSDRLNPDETHRCANGTTIRGALISVKQAPRPSTIASPQSDGFARRSLLQRD